MTKPHLVVTIRARKLEGGVRAVGVIEDDTVFIHTGPNASEVEQWTRRKYPNHTIVFTGDTPNAP